MIVYGFILVCRCNYNSILHQFRVIWRSKYRDLEIRLGVIEGHWKWHHSIDRIRVLFVFHCNYGRILCRFAQHSNVWLIFTSVSETMRKPPLVKAQTALKTKINKYGEKQFSIWRMELLHPAMWEVAVRWHAMEFVQTSAILERYIWFRFWPYHRITACSQLHVILAQSAKFYPNRTTLGRKNTSCRFSRWRISAILDFRGPIMGSLKSPCTTF